MRNRHSFTLSSLRYASRLARMPLAMRTARAASTRCPLTTAGSLSVLSPRYLTESFFRRSPTHDEAGCHPADDMRRSSPFRVLPGIVWSRVLWVTVARSAFEAVSGCPRALVHAIRRIGRIFVAGSIGTGPGWKICVAKLVKLDYIRQTDRDFSSATSLPGQPRRIRVRPGHNLFRTSPERLQAET